MRTSIVTPRALTAIGCAFIAAIVALAVTAPFVYADTTGNLASSSNPQIRAVGGTFPERKFVLTLPPIWQQKLTPNSLQIRENGAVISGAKVSSTSTAQKNTFGTILAIDASGSMKGSIDNAMAAARDFARYRQPSQALGVIFFNSKTTIALPPTTDPQKINQALSKPPTLKAGTNIYDATLSAFTVLKQAHIQAGSVVVLSDGADGGSKATPTQVQTTGAAQHVRVFTVGVQSGSFDGSSLSRLAREGGGSYALASSSTQLKSIFNSFAQVFANEYLITYKSHEASKSRVFVTAKIAGLTGIAQTSYFASGKTHSTASIWSGSITNIALALVLALLLGLVVFLLIRSLRSNVRSRVGQFVAPGELKSEKLAATLKESQSAALDNMTRALERRRWWEAFALEVEIARIPITPVRIAMLTLAATLFALWLFVGVVGQPLFGLFALGVPAGVGLTIHIKARRERKLFADQLLDNLQVISSAMRAGHSFVGALSAVVNDAPQPSKREFQRVIQDEQLGMPVEQALSETGQRMQSPEIEHVGLIAVLQRDTGGNTAEVLDRINDTVRERGKLRRMVSSLTAQGRLGGIVVSALPVALVSVISVLNPHFLDPMLTQTAGKIMVGFAAFLIVCGWIIIYRIVNIKV